MAKIIAPCTHWKNAKDIFIAGADMIYMGLSGFCRKEKESLSYKDISLAIDNFSKYGKFIVAMNKVPPFWEFHRFMEAVERVCNLGVYGVILNDLGLIYEVKRRFPNLFIMASVGLSPINFREVSLIKEAGANSVLLSEFLGVEEVAKIKKKVDVQIEVFASGVLEFGYTGKCILSSYYKQEYKNFVLGSAKRGGWCWDVCRGNFCGGNKESPLPLVSYNLTLEKFKALLPYVDIFKVWQRSLKGEKLLSIIRMYRKIIDGQM